MAEKKSKRKIGRQIPIKNNAANVKVRNGTVFIPVVWRNQLCWPKEGEIKAELRNNSIVLTYDRIMCVGCEKPCPADDMTFIGNKGKALCRDCLADVTGAAGDKPAEGESPME